MKSTDQASESSKVGIAPRFQSALELCGRTDQDGMSVAHYGYLAHIHGLPLDERSSGPADDSPDSRARRRTGDRRGWVVGRPAPVAGFPGRSDT